jgi:NAD+ diphosphatase
VSAEDLAKARHCLRCGAGLACAEHGGRLRPSCPACGWVHWGNPTPVVAAVIELDGRVLLARNAAWAPGMFGLVTGFLEAGEDPSAAVRREVQEETALATRERALIGAYPFKPMNQVIIAYHVVAAGTVRLSAELSEYRLLEPHRVRPWRLGTGLALADWLSARGLPVHFIDWDRGAARSAGA